ncbi:MAG: hypothetical protein DRH50_16140 [Deltaproteobacteria bacterium]|nr:MAG: hypothetical protein DRH50_16140 [Deltaproteobacteria bacterium]
MHGIRAIAALGLLLWIVLLPQSLLATGNSCVPPLTNTDIKKICDILLSEPKNSISTATVDIEARLTDLLKIGLHRKLAEARGCYRLSGAEIRLYIEGEDTVGLDHYRKIGDTSDSQNIQVLSCQDRRQVSGEKRYVDVSVQLFWRPIPADPPALKVKKPHIAVGEATEITAQLLCGPCGMPSETIYFHSGSGGDISPRRVVTDQQGLAHSVFTLRQEKTVKISARHKKKHKEIIIEPQWRPWHIKVNIYFQARDTGYRSKAEFQGNFENVLLGKIANNAMAAIKSGKLLGYPLDFLQMHTPIKTVGSLKGWEKHLVNECWEQLDFNRQTAANLLIGLKFHSGAPESKGMTATVQVSPVLLFTGNAGQYYFGLNQYHNICDDETITEPTAISLDLVQNRQLIFYNFKVENCAGKYQWRYEFKFKPE